MSVIYTVLEDLAATSLRNEKIEILMAVPSNHLDLFHKVCRYALDPSFDYYIKEFDMPNSFYGSNRLEDVLHVLDTLNNREVTGDSAKALLGETLSSLTKEDAEVFRRIIKRDLRCGVSSKTLNKVWDNLIYVHPRMRASSFSEKNLKNLRVPCISQTKMDGLYCDMIVDNSGVVKFLTLSGARIDIGLPFDGHIQLEDGSEWDRGFVVQGEILAKDTNGNLMDRSSSNGYINSDDVDPSRVAFFVWDVISYDGFMKGKYDVIYVKRLENVSGLAEKVSWIHVVETVVCDTRDDVIKHFKEKRADGEEGTIVKNTNMIWKTGTSKDQIKVKVIFEADYKIVGYKEGKNKFEGLIGSLELESSDGKISFFCGGFTDKVRKELTRNIDYHVERGTVVSVKGNDVIANELKPNKYAVYLPRFSELRVDKKEADDYNRVIQQLESYQDAIKF